MGGGASIPIDTDNLMIRVHAHGPQTAHQYEKRLRWGYLTQFQCPDPYESVDMQYLAQTSDVQAAPRKTWLDEGYVVKTSAEAAANMIAGDRKRRHAENARRIRVLADKLGLADRYQEPQPVVQIKPKKGKRGKQEEEKPKALSVDLQVTLLERLAHQRSRLEEERAKEEAKAAEEHRQFVLRHGTHWMRRQPGSEDPASPKRLTSSTPSLPSAFMVASLDSSLITAASSGDMSPVVSPKAKVDGPKKVEDRFKRASRAQIKGLFPPAKNTVTSLPDLRLRTSFTLVKQ
eukprot:gb/GFBE01041791.1/.p1 GENE.gb/GFBE01041791.1/~~gb/GFBE01041791.1/.p1  ORF type:complete len:289 (+),score=60.68 gb/GFBE01041791.1/:1-867(+)